MQKIRVALVTGAASGIGAAVVEKLLEMGLQVCVTDHEEGALTLFVKNLKTLTSSDKILPQLMDVGDRSSVEKVRQVLQSQWGGVDVVVNNAGLFLNSSILDMKDEDFEKILNVNLLGAFRVSQIFASLMVERGGGKIINISSISGLKGAPQAAHYAASKAGMLALAKSMAVEFAPYNIQVNTILPGFVETNMMASTKEVLKKVATWRIPVKRLGLPWEIAETVGHFANSRSSYLTGSEVVIDGGFSLG